MKIHAYLRVTILILFPHLPQFVLAQGNLVFNGTFDADASGWMTNGIGRDGGYYSAKGNPDGYFLLDNTPAPSISPTISQTIDGLIPNNEYVISGDYSWSLGLGNTFSTNTPSFGVAVDGTLLYEAVGKNDNLNWQSFSFLYIPTASSITLSLSAQLNGTEISYAVDNIAMYAIPEPTAAALLLAGLGILGLRRCNRKHPLP